MPPRPSSSAGTSPIIHPWKTLSRRLVLDLGRYLVVENHTLELPDGKIIPDWAWIITPDYVNIVAVTPEDQIICFRQTKYSVTGDTLAVVGGFIEPGEEPLAAAQRELQEETGYTASRWIGLGSYAVDGNRGNGNAHFFLALDAKLTAPTHADDLEEQHLLLLSTSEVRDALMAGEFKVLPWTTIVALALQFIETRSVHH
jgi:ADP-ribose pyrophosphatase